MFFTGRYGSATGPLGVKNRTLFADNSNNCIINITLTKVPESSRKRLESQEKYCSIPQM